MTPRQLEALARRCEEAVSPDRELDVEIALALDWHGKQWGSIRKFHLLNDLAACARFGDMPAYTASLDAAMELKGESAVLITLSEIKGDGMPHCVLGNPATSELFRAVAATPALALVAASLRARSLRT